MNKNYSKYEHFAGSATASASVAATDNAYTEENTSDTLQCYRCVGSWPARRCVIKYDDECQDGDYEKYNDCAVNCGMGDNAANPSVAAAAASNTNNKNSASSKVNSMNNKINKLLNNKLKGHPTFNPNDTEETLYERMEAAYAFYIKNLPYNPPKQFSLGVFLVILLAFTIPNVMLTIFGHKSITSCTSGINQSVVLSIFITLLLILSWAGSVLPYYGYIASLISMAVTVIVVVFSNLRCRD
jgi:hypothetical protein